MSADRVECDVSQDFIRHISNRVFAEAIKKIPASAVSELRKRLGRLEDKYDFSLYGGRPERLAEALSSPEWRDLVDYAEKTNVSWVLAEILKRALEAYKGCPSVAEKIRAELERLTRKEGEEEEELSLEQVFRDLRFRGFKVSREQDRLLVDEGNITVELSVVGGVIEYSICKQGKTSTLDGLLARIEKMREL